MSSAADFVEGGIQDSCEDACSICLEAFCAEDPASVTTCNHAYHIQCILEWVQRSSDCPMCWQPLTMKDAAGQELLSSAERERSHRASRVQIPIYPQFRSEDYDLENFSSFEERLMHYLAAHQVRAHWRTDRFHFRQMLSERPGQFLYFPTTAAPSPVGFASTVDTSEDGGAEEEQLANPNGHSFIPMSSPARARGSCSLPSRPGSASNGASTSESQSFSEAVKSRFSAVSSKYKESFSKTARFFKEKLRGRNATNSEVGAGSGAVNCGVTKSFGQLSLGSAVPRRAADEVHH